MKKIAAFLLALLLSFSLFVSAFAVDTDEMNISADISMAEELGIPTKRSVSQLKKTADDYWDAKDYRNAAPAYSDYAKNAGWLADIIAAIDKPYYSASSDNRRYFQRNPMYETAASAEKEANDYQEERNKACTREALCYYYLGDYITAVPLLMKALELIDITDSENWKLCADAINNIVDQKGISA